VALSNVWCAVALRAGDPVFDKLEAELAKRCSAARNKGFEIGSGFLPPPCAGRSTTTLSRWRGNGCGLDQRSAACKADQNGEDIYFRGAFKRRLQSRASTTVTTGGQATKLSARVRHDPVRVARPVPDGGGYDGTGALRSRFAPANGGALAGREAKIKR